MLHTRMLHTICTKILCTEQEGELELYVLTSMLELIAGLPVLLVSEQIMVQVPLSGS